MSAAARYVMEPDGMGGIRHVMRPMSEIPAPPVAGRKRKRVTPDPIKASAESAAQQLKLFIERVERMDEEIADLLSDRQDVFKEAKGQGFDPPTMLRILARRKKEKHIVDEADALFETYTTALGLA
jgi:uncharacterized protein (UPF0335 family)